MHSVVLTVHRILARLTGAGPERLVSVGICALLLAASLVSALPPASASTPQGPWSQYGTGNGGPLSAGQEDGADQVDVLPTDAPELAIANVFQNPAEAAQSRTGFTWYVVQNGDSLQGIATRYNLKIETLYFANAASLGDPLAINAGLRLLIPPMDGATVVVADGQTLMDVANAYQISGQAIIDANGLSGPTLTAGQTLVVPGAFPGELPGAPGADGGTKYVGGSLWWPVDGPWHISQGFWSGHHAIDIAAAFGTPVLAAAGGRVVYAGWKSQQEGGNVVWIEHTGSLYTTYNHLSKWNVHYGETVRAGQLIGWIGMSGETTGPHLHFEVWLGYPWHDGTNRTAVNPCHYLVHC